MKKRPEFPAEIYVTRDSNSDASDAALCNDLLAWSSPGDGVVDDGPTRVATYRLLHVVTVSKRIVVE